MTVAASLVALLVAFAATTGIQARRIARERDRANREAETAKAVNDFLQNDLLAQAGASAQARPDTKPDPDLKVRTALDRAAAGIEGKFEAQPLVEASIRLTIGKTYEDLGLYPEAERHLERALDLRRRVLGEEDASSLTKHERHGRAVRQASQIRGSRPAVHEVPERLPGARWGEEHPQTLTIVSGLGRLYMLQGKHLGGRAALHQGARGQASGAWRTASRHADRAWMPWPACIGVKASTRRPSPSEAKVVELQRRVLGEEHPETLTSINNLALLSSYQGKYAEAEALFIQVLEIMRRVLGDDHLETMISAGNLGIVYFRQGRYAEAEAVFTRVLEQKQRVLGAEHPETLTSMNNLAVLYRAEGKYSQAEPLYVRVMEVQRRVLGDEHPNMLLTMNGLALLYGFRARTPRPRLCIPRC